MNPCGKVWYADEQSATEALFDLFRGLRRTKWRDRLLGAYFCDRCEGWHFGHNYLEKITHLCIGEHK